MTGYGKAESLYGQDKLVVEIRSVNGKNSDISLKTQLIPREREVEVRQLISQKLQRGNIDLFANVEYAQEGATKTINKQVFLSYYNQIKAINEELDEKLDYSGLINCIVKLPDVIEIQKREVDVDNWDQLKSCIIEALISITEFRAVEGKKLEEDIRGRVGYIMDHLGEVEKYEQERSETIKTRLTCRLEELSQSLDRNRLEQEIIYYLEKLDVTEEKVRLTQHCKYFLETLEGEEFPGKKLGFIAQEMGREINTLGSKANNAEMQKWVVRMKDELEKIKEQTLNIL
ncbi:MAG: YicC family protein [Bacteroidetes bacterium GWF2_40_14]|nr:MAG: YicC family protein [Bacteroidetes bacterium GWF2_40_14]